MALQRCWFGFRWQRVRCGTAAPVLRPARGFHAFISSFRTNSLARCSRTRTVPARSPVISATSSSVSPSMSRNTRTMRYWAGNFWIASRNVPASSLRIANLSGLIPLSELNFPIPADPASILREKVPDSVRTCFGAGSSGSGSLRPYKARQRAPWGCQIWAGVEPT